MDKWRLPTDISAVWRSWDEDEHVVFHPGTSDTHLLNDVAQELLGLLESEDLTNLELANRCAAAFGIEASDDFLNHVSESLQLFDELGLVEIAT